MSDFAKTIRREKTADDALTSGPERLSCVFLVLECHDPKARGARYVVDRDLDEIVFGRGPARSHEREGKRLTARIADPMMSSAHARIIRGDDGFSLEDMGSTNGTRVDGKRIERVPLEDGTFFELGSTIFRFREEIELDAADARVVESPMAIPGLSTLLPAYARALGKFGRVALSAVPILLLGESGTGKEVLAQVAHKLSARSGQFVAVNCGALPETLVESQLFGHVKGAFSGAVKDELGFVRSSDKGTLFLDEIGDLPKTSQAALLRVIQEREVTPIGSTKAHKVDLRIVSATHRRIDVLQRGDVFRADLFARLSGFTLELLPLRERKEDLGVIVAALLSRIAPDASIANDLGRALVKYDWPLNVRELEQMLSVAAVLADDGVIRMAHVPEATRKAFDAPQASSPPQVPASSGDEDALRRALVDKLTRTGGNISEVARDMGRTRMQIHRWMKRWGIDPEAFRRPNG